MILFPRKKRPAKPPGMLSVARYENMRPLGQDFDAASYGLYDALRRQVPIIDAALLKIVRLTGQFRLVSEDARFQGVLDRFCENVPVGLTGCSLQAFADGYLDSLLTYGNALGEMILDSRFRQIAQLSLAPPRILEVRPGKEPGQREYYLRQNGDAPPWKLPYPERILFTALAPPPGGVYGVSVLQGLPALSEILLRIYECIGQNYDRLGNVRYAVTYNPGNDPADRAYAGERTKQIAAAWSDGMRSGARGEVRDFICAGQVDIKVIGADSAMPNTEVPVRQLLEQLIAKLSIPPFLLGLNWSTTERMSKQQADILTSELEYYRRTLEPALRQIGKSVLRLAGSGGDVAIEWSSINLQDETDLAQARLWNAQASALEGEQAKRDAPAGNG